MAERLTPERLAEIRAEITGLTVEEVASIVAATDEWPGDTQGTIESLIDTVNDLLSHIDALTEELKAGNALHARHCDKTTAKIGTLEADLVRAAFTIAKLTEEVELLRAERPKGE